MDGPTKREVDEARKLALSETPKYLFIRCDTCDRRRRVEREGFGTRTDREGPNKDKRIVFGICNRCGEEIQAPITTDEEIRLLVKESLRLFNRAEARRKKRRKGKKKLATKTRKRKNKKSDEDEEDKKTKKSKAKTTKAKKKDKKEKKSKKNKAKTAERGKIWGPRPDGAMNGKDSMAASVAGGMYTLEEFDERHGKLVKEKEAPKRTEPWAVTSLSWLCNNVDDVYRSINEDGDDVFGAPNVKPPKSLGGNKKKISTKKGVPYFKGMPLVKTRKEAKALID